MIGSRKMEKHMPIIEQVFTFIKSRVIITAVELDQRSYYSFTDIELHGYIYKINGGLQ
jgi:hypothetical protein